MASAADALMFQTDSKKGDRRCERTLEITLSCHLPMSINDSQVGHQIVSNSNPFT
jgi:hypothetical protein